MKKMSKKKITSILAVCLLCIVAFAGFTVWKTKKCIDLIAYGSTIPLMDMREGRQIIADFPDEIACVQDERGIPISELTNQSLDLIRSVAVRHWEDPSLDFSGLIHDITQASFLYRINTINLSLPTYQKGLNTKDFEVQDAKLTVLVPYGVLSGRFDEPFFPAGTLAHINSGTFTFKPGAAVQGVPITKHFTSDYSYTLMGPEFGDRMIGEEFLVGHSAGLSILYGSVVRQEYDLLHLPSGRTHHVDQTVIADSFIESYTLKCSLGMPTYIQHIFKPTLLEFEQELAF